MSNARRRRSSIADLTGRLLIDDMDDESAPLAAAPPNSPLDSSAGAKGAGAENNPYILPYGTLNVGNLLQIWLGNSMTPAAYEIVVL